MTDSLEEDALIYLRRALAPTGRELGDRDVRLVERSDGNGEARFVFEVAEERTLAIEGDPASDELCRWVDRGGVRFARDRPYDATELRILAEETVAPLPPGAVLDGEPTLATEDGRRVATVRWIREDDERAADERDHLNVRINPANGLVIGVRRRWSSPDGAD